MKQAISTEARAAPQQPRTFGEFLQQYDDAHAEWVNGEVLTVMPASVEHQDTNMFLLTQRVFIAVACWRASGWRWVGCGCVRRCGGC